MSSYGIAQKQENFDLFMPQQQSFIPQQQQNVCIPKQLSKNSSYRNNLYDDDDDFNSQDIMMNNTSTIASDPLVKTYLKILLSKVT